MGSSKVRRMSTGSTVLLSAMPMAAETNPGAIPSGMKPEA